jgi:hypothetical protein
LILERLCVSSRDLCPPHPWPNSWAAS